MEASMRTFQPILLGAALVLSLATGPALADDAKTKSTAPQAEIPFANLGGISGWVPDGNKALYIQGRNGKWYHATLMSPCYGMRDGEAIAFASTPMGTFDHFSAIIADHQECRVSSLVESDGPPKKADKKK
jgi:hypothetical protein